MSKLKSPRCASLFPELSLTGAKGIYKTGIGAAVNVTVSAFLLLSAVGARSFAPTALFKPPPRELKFGLTFACATRKPDLNDIFDAQKASGSRPGSGDGAPGRYSCTARLRPEPKADPLPIPGTPEADIVVPVLWFVPVTVRRADVLWIVVPRPAPQNTFGRVPLL